MNEDKKFKPGDIVFHKATLNRGVIKKSRDQGEDDWWIVWEDSKMDSHSEVELYTKKEHDEKYGPGVATT